MLPSLHVGNSCKKPGIVHLAAAKVQWCCKFDALLAGQLAQPGIFHLACCYAI